MAPIIRAARADDREEVIAFTSGTWPERDVEDYLPHVFDRWIDADGERRRTVVAEVDGTVCGICQCVLLTEHEAWLQGMRVHPECRGMGVGRALTHALFDWARERGATVARNMVFSWNGAGLGLSRSIGFEPVTEFRWAHPEPDPGREDPTEIDGVTDDPDLAWRAWQGSDAWSTLRGLALDADETWALSELTRDDISRMADDERVLAVTDGGAGAMAFRARTYEREHAGGSEGEGESGGGNGSDVECGADVETGSDAENGADAETGSDAEVGTGEGRTGTVKWAEYGVGSWTDLDAARTLFAAISADAASIGADRTRVLVPETVRHVSDAAAARVEISDEPDFVLAADLTTR